MTFRSALQQLAGEMGFQLRRSGHHLIWHHPSGAQVVTSATPSDRHAINQVQRQFRRALTQFTA